MKAIRPVRDMPVMPERCSTCPFNEDGSIDVRNNVIDRTLQGINQTCHSSGAAKDKPDSHLCRGAREYQMELFYRLGVLEAPTEEAWQKALCQIEQANAK